MSNVLAKLACRCHDQPNAELAWHAIDSINIDRVVDFESSSPCIVTQSAALSFVYLTTFGGLFLPKGTLILDQRSVIFSFCWVDSCQGGFCCSPGTITGCPSSWAEVCPARMPKNVTISSISVSTTHKVITSKHLLLGEAAIASSHLDSSKVGGNILCSNNATSVCKSYSWTSSLITDRHALTGTHWGCTDRQCAGAWH